MFSPLFILVIQVPSASPRVGQQKTNKSDERGKKKKTTRKGKGGVEYARSPNESFFFSFFSFRCLMTVAPSCGWFSWCSQFKVPLFSSFSSCPQLSLSFSHVICLSMQESFFTIIIASGVGLLSFFRTPTKDPSLFLL